MVFICNFINITYSKYESKTSISADANVAFYIVNQGRYNNTISLNGITPSAEPFIYTINVANFNETNRTKVKLDYKISIETTTNIPLEYSIIEGNNYTLSSTNLITSTTTRQDENNVYYKTMNTNNTYHFGYSENEVDEFTLIIYFPLEYKNNSDAYQSLIDLVDIIVDAEQVI